MLRRRKRRHHREQQRVGFQLKAHADRRTEQHKRRHHRKHERAERFDPQAQKAGKRQIAQQRGGVEHGKFSDISSQKHNVLPPFHAADLIFGETVDYFKAVVVAERKAHAVHQNDAVAVEFERFVHVDEHAPVAGQKPLVALQHRFQLGESLQAFQERAETVNTSSVCPWEAMAAICPCGMRMVWRGMRISTCGSASSISRIAPESTCSSWLV